MTIWLNGLASCQGGGAANILNSLAFSRGVHFALWHSLQGEMMAAEKNPILRGKSMELLKDLTQILQEIIRSGDEESFRRLQETIRAIDESRRKPGRTIH